MQYCNFWSYSYAVKRCNYIFCISLHLCLKGETIMDAIKLFWNKIFESEVLAKLKYQMTPNFGFDKHQITIQERASLYSLYSIESMESKVMWRSLHTMNALVWKNIVTLKVMRLQLVIFNSGRLKKHPRKLQRGGSILNAFWCTDMLATVSFYKNYQINWHGILTYQQKVDVPAIIHFHFCQVL